MNALIVGSRKTAILEHIPDGDFLLIDDGPIIDQIDQIHRRARLFDVAKHSFNPLKDISYRKAREFISVIDAAFPEGENTLTNRNARFQLLTALMESPTRLDRLVSDAKDTHDAWQKITTILLSPVLNAVLNGSPRLSFPFTGTILARLDRAALGDFDCFVLGNLLIAEYPGTIVIPDFGFYAHQAHKALIRQGRLVAGVNFLDEAPQLRNALLLIETKVPSRSTIDDAKTLAAFSGLRPDLSRDDNEYNRFVDAALS